MNVIDQVAHKGWVALTLAGTGIIRPTRPDKLVRVGKALRDWGPTPAAGYAASAIRFPNDNAIVDELGTLTFGDVHRRTNALARALADRGVKEGDGVAIMCRNHRGFIDTTVACSKLGPTRSTSTPRSRARRSPTSWPARSRPRWSTTRSSRDRREAGRARALHRLAEGPGQPDPPSRTDRATATRPPAAPGEKGA
jgi:hypothetical protein